MGSCIIADMRLGLKGVNTFPSAFSPDYNDLAANQSLPRHHLGVKINRKAIIIKHIIRLQKNFS